MMLKRKIDKVSLMLVYVLAACSPRFSPTQAPSPEPQPTAAEAYHPLETQVGIEEIDQVTKAVASGNTEMLRSLVKFTSAPCTLQEGLGGPPKCREGEAEGTLIEVLPFLGGEGSFIRKDEIESWPGIEVAGLYAVYRVSPAVTSEQYYPAGEFAILFVGPKNRPAVSLRIGDGGIVRVDHILDGSLKSLDAILQREASEVILAPGLH